MEKTRIKALLDKYTAGQLTDAQEVELFDILNLPGSSDVQDVFLESLEEEAKKPVQVNEIQLLAMFQSIVNVDKVTVVEMKEVSIKPVPLITIKQIWWAAALIILVLGISLYTWQSSKAPGSKQTAKVSKSSKAFLDEVTLTMADGTKVVLDSLGKGIISTQNGSSVVLKDSQLVYEKSALTSDKVLYNTLQTSKARQFQIQLPDGSMVWLNASSSLRFPTAFTGTERKVEVSGEAYFEVAKNAAKPFVVNIADRGEVKVLGTHFNINAYANEEQIKTTLLEGRVQFKTSEASNGTVVVLKPGQQAQINRAETESSSIAVANDIDLDKVIAWKNGRFNFEGLSLKEVMKQLEQWYDIEVVFKDGVPDIEFYGELSRSSTLTEMLEALKDADVHFRMDGKRLTVLK